MLITFQTCAWFSFVPNPLRNTKQIRRTDRQTEKGLLCAAARCLTFTHSRSLPRSTVYLVQELAGKTVKVSGGKKTSAKSVGSGTGRADCNEAPRGPDRLETKEPTGVLHTRRRKEKCQFSCPPPLGLIL